MAERKIVHRFNGATRALDNRFVEADGHSVAGRFAALERDCRAAEPAGDWDSRRDHVMHSLVRDKFRDFELRKVLIATGGARLIDGGTAADRYWGMNLHTGGQNQLGKILERVRDEILADPAAMAEIAAAAAAERAEAAAGIAREQSAREAQRASLNVIADRIDTANTAATSDLVSDLRDAYERMGMSPYVLALATGLSLKRASRIERSDFNPKLSEIRLIANALSVTFEYSIN